MDELCYKCLFCGALAGWWVFDEYINCSCGAFAWAEREGQ